MPAFLDSAWLEGLTDAGVVQQRWFIHVAQGQNLRNAAELPIPLTRRQAHLYLQAPGDFDALSAFRWAQVIDMGGDERLARSIQGTMIGKSFDHDDFWVTVLRWLIDQPMLDPMHHAPIIDYLHNQRFVASAPNPRAGLPGQGPLVPPQPNLSMKGRDAERPAPRGRPLAQAAGICCSRSDDLLEADRESYRSAMRREKESRARVYTIAELRNSYELQAEGQAMAHCVASYTPSCVRGIVSIWSLRVIDASGQETALADARGDQPRPQDRPGPAEVQCASLRARTRVPQAVGRHGRAVTGAVARSVIPHGPGGL